MMMISTMTLWFIEVHIFKQEMVDFVISRLFGGLLSRHSRNLKISEKLRVFSQFELMFW